jgi:hypothetical protein
VLLHGVNTSGSSIAIFLHYLCKFKYANV